MEAKAFAFQIITPTNSQAILVDWIEVESPTGSFFVGPDHSPLISIIKNKSTIVYKKSDESETLSLVVSQGIFKVAENKALALLDQ